MGFNRALVSPDGKIPQPMRAGVGLLANFNPTANDADAVLAVSVAQLAGGFLIQTKTLTADRTFTLPTAALIAAAFPEMDIGDSYSFVVTNAQAAAFDVVVTVAAGITAAGTNNSLDVNPESQRIFTLVKTAAATFDLY